MPSDASELARLCAKAGADVSLVQGTGGNASVKTDSEMLVKASGIRLSDVSEQNGLVRVDYQRIARFYSEAREGSELEADLVFEKAVLDENARPSIEAPFHSLFAKFVLHTHPVYALLLACSKSGEQKTRELFPDALWIPYRKPSFQLAFEIAKRLQGEKIVFLQNHGLIVSAETAGECWTQTLEVEGKARKAFADVEDFHYQPLEAVEGGFLDSSQLVIDYFATSAGVFLMPDAAVFIAKICAGEGNAQFIPDKGVFYALDEKRARNIDEVVQAHAFLVSALKEDKRALNENEVNAVLAMSSEKYRQKMVGE